MDPEYDDDDGIDLDEDMDMEFEAELDDEDYEIDDEVDEMLDAMMEDEDEDDEDLSERRRRRRSRRRGRRYRRKPVKKARGRSAYRGLVSRRYVNQRQLKEALDRVGKDVRRNALGIKTVNSRFGRLNGRVSGVVSVNRVQSRRIGKLDRQMRMDGALEFAESYDAATGEISLDKILKGAVKSGMLGDSKGALSNPLVIGGLGLVLRQPGILGGLLNATRG